MTKLKSRRQAPTKSGYFNYGPEKLPHSVPKGPLGLVQGKVFLGKLKLSAALN
jgi:hypothetical protein